MTATKKLCDCTINTGCTKQFESELCLCRQNNDLPWAEKSVDTLRPILKQRGQEYGDYIVMSNCIQEIKAVYRKYGLDKLPAFMREALEMDATKTGRILVGNENNKDSWRDRAGYCTLVADRL